MEVLSARVQGEFVVAQLMGVADRDQALALRGRAVAVRRSDLPVASEQEFYWLDLIGCVVVNKEGAVIGPVIEVFENGVHSILRIFHSTTPQTAKLNLNTPKVIEVLIPFVAQYVGKVDSDGKRIEVEWPMSWVLDSDTTSGDSSA